VKNDALATVTPPMEIFHLKDRKTSIRALHNGVRVNGDGHPLPVDDEVIVARWGGVANLVAVMSPDGLGPRRAGVTYEDELLKFTIGKEYDLFKVAEGNLALAVGQTRLVGSFERARGAVGEMDADKRRVLTFSWPYEDVHFVDFVKKQKMFGGEKVVQVTVQCVDPPGALTVGSATALDDSWTSAWVPHNDLEGFARSIADAAARFRQSQPDRDDSRLDSVLAGEWTIDGNEHTAWLVDPEVTGVVPRLRAAGLEPVFEPPR
jgi:hypothetical protein